MILVVLKSLLPLIFLSGYELYAVLHRLLKLLIVGLVSGFGRRLQLTVLQRAVIGCIQRFLEHNRLNL